VFVFVFVFCIRIDTTNSLTSLNMFLILVEFLSLAVVTYSGRPVYT